jgi:hypothetical protein
MSDFCARRDPIHRTTGLGKRDNVEDELVLLRKNLDLGEQRPWKIMNACLYTLFGSGAVVAYNTSSGVLFTLG